MSGDRNLTQAWITGRGLRPDLRGVVLELEHRATLALLPCPSALGPSPYWEVLSGPGPAGAYLRDPDPLS